MKKIENSFVVTGFVANDAQVRNFETASVARFSIAISRSEKKGKETSYTSAFLPVEAWRKNEAATAFEKIKKGEILTVKGYFKPEEWTDKETGYKRNPSGCPGMIMKKWTDKETGYKRNRISLVAVEFYPAPDKEEEKPVSVQKKAKKSKTKKTESK